MPRAQDARRCCRETNQQPGARKASRDQETQGPSDAGLTRQWHQDEDWRRMGTAMKLSELSQHERLAELLRQLGHDFITSEEFWSQMQVYGLTYEDIDKF